MTKKKKYIVNLAAYACLTLLAVFLIIPFFFMLMRSIMPAADITHWPIRLIPTQPTFQAYRTFLSKQGYFLNLWNTSKIVAVNMVSGPLSASLCAFGFSKIGFRGKKYVFAAMMTTIMVPGAIIQVPLYVLYANLGWTETILPLVIPGFFGGGAMTIFLIMQFMKNIPLELDNAAQIDGAGVLRRYLMITVPLCMPILLYMVVGAFTATWSDFYGPLVYLKNANSYTLAIRIYYDNVATGAISPNSNIRMAAGVFMTVPPALIFFVYQRKLVDGLFIGAIKA